MDPRTPRARRFPGDPPAPTDPARPRAPEIPLEVVEWLERLHPEVTTPDAHLHGQRSVALRARREYNLQQEKQ